MKNPKSATAAFTAEKNENFQEVRVLRNPATRDGNKLIHTFKILDIVREGIRIRQAEADVLNTGVREFVSNQIFSMYIKEGEKMEIEPYEQHLK